ncbi:hypothetical protein J7D62_001539 [Campylobacter lari]|nr:response regulator [Campylobacter lari]EHH0538420.1 hypothetical protein [Campylobacter lari]MCV3522460.1 hypothetical protein [Campylobacter lari]MCV3540500.1 hypothetical protein [Campylobacter lari]HEC1747204.1 hypothetical protein [Campylobacter lari]
MNKQVKTIRILFVDDNQETLDAYEESIKEENDSLQEESIQYKAYKALTYEKALDILDENRIDIAVIDLDLGSEFTGEDITKYILERYSIPIFIATGKPADFDNELIRPMVKVLNRDNMRLFDEIKKQMQSKLVRFFSKNNGFLERQIVEFFWEHMSKNLPYWEQYAIDEIDLVLLRHTTTCLNEKLYVNNSSEKYFNKYHPGEMYIYPFIKGEHHTGDIVKKNDDFFIILTPSCDIVQNKYEYHVLARIINSDCTRESFYPIKNFAKIFEVDNKDKEILKPSICFQGLISVKKEEISDYARVASISYPFLKDIIARFSRYYARQGCPEIIKNFQ